MKKLFVESSGSSVKNSGWFFVFILGIIVGVSFCIWLFSPISLDILTVWGVVADLNKPVDLTKRGQFGDSFGFATSFFSFLSFLGVLGVFFMQKRHMEVRERPFLMASIPNLQLPLKLSRLADLKSYQITFSFGVNNYSEHLAHSCQFEFNLKSKNGTKDLPIRHWYRPIIRHGEDQLIVEKWTLGVEDTCFLLNDLSSKVEVELFIKMSYKNSNGISYADRNNFILTLDENEYGAIDELRRGHYSEGIWGGGKFVSIKVIESEPFVTHL